jgi:hypothetical protein
MQTDAEIAIRFNQMSPVLNERALRIFVAAEANALGHGGVTRISKITGIARSTIKRGQDEIAQGSTSLQKRIRNPGGGRKKTVFHYPDWPQALEKLIDPLSRGDPESPLRWTIKSTKTLSEELKRQGYPIAPTQIRHALHAMQYSLQANRKIEEGQEHPDRNAQFEYINTRVEGEIARNNPVISVDTKKKEILGNFKNNGKSWHPKGEAPKVQDHEFPASSLPRAYPYGIYDLARNRGHVVIGTDHDTGAFAVASIHGWWKTEGLKLYPKATHLLVTADSGGSNGYRFSLWKYELQRFADEIGLPISVCHFPPGTSKWNKIEHRLFSFISTNWRGEPLKDYETIVRLISNTRTSKGLVVNCTLDHRAYPIGIRISKKEMEKLNITRDKFHGEWNYTLYPRINK